MATRHEITKRYAKEYGRASKKDTGRMLDELVAVAVAAWSRANARQGTAAAAKRRGPARAVQRKPRVVDAIEEVLERLPYPMVGLACDNGEEFINHALIGWCAERTIFMTRARAHTSNDNAHVEQKNGDIADKSAFRYPYNTPEELAPLNELWGYVNLRKSLFLPTKKANGWRGTKAGRNTRTYDDPRPTTSG